MIAEHISRLSISRRPLHVNVIHCEQATSLVSLADCLEASTKHVLHSMCSIDVEATEILDTQCEFNRYAINGLIAFSGSVQATIVVSVEMPLLAAMAERMLGISLTSIDADAVDLVGELANMIGGNAKERLGIHGVILGLPTTSIGEECVVALASNLMMTRLRFNCETGSLCITIGVGR